MELKILHTSDIHIGMRFAGYPDNVRERLVEARFEVLERLIGESNRRRCQIFAVAGDLFEKTTVPTADINHVLQILKKFEGDCILLLPGNHDYDNGESELWNLIDRNHGDKMLILNRNRPYPLQSYGLNAVVYPAFCDRKHSEKNNLQWIREWSERPEGMWHIGMAHGSLEGVSPDLENRYYSMRISELEALHMDAWLLGHVHIPFPKAKEAQGARIFNAGTPEPDGMDCAYNGAAWELTLTENGGLKAGSLEPGHYRFRDDNQEIRKEEDFLRLVETYCGPAADRTLLRLNLSGTMDPETYSRRHRLLEPMRDKLFYFTYSDSGLKPRITRDQIDHEFTEGSLPHRFLLRLLERGDESAAQEAYEMIREVRGR